MASEEEATPDLYGRDQGMSEEDDEGEDYDGQQGQGQQPVHILVMHKNTSICLKFRDGSSTAKGNDSHIPLVFNKSLKELFGAFDKAGVPLPDTAVVVISQYVFGEKEIKFKCKLYQHVRPSIAISGLNMDHGIRALRGAYSTDVRGGHALLKRYQNTICVIDTLAQEFYQKRKTEKWDFHRLFDEYVYSKICELNDGDASTTSCIGLCRAHYVINKATS